MLRMFLLFSYKHHFYDIYITIGKLRNMRNVNGSVLERPIHNMIIEDSNNP
jgi:hypothetical protein